MCDIFAWNWSFWSCVGADIQLTLTWRLKGPQSRKYNHECLFRSRFRLIRSLGCSWPREGPKRRLLGEFHVLFRAFWVDKKDKLCCRFGWWTGKVYQVCWVGIGRLWWQTWLGGLSGDSIGKLLVGEVRFVVRGNRELRWVWGPFLCYNDYSTSPN